MVLVASLNAIATGGLFVINLLESASAIMDTLALVAGEASQPINIQSHNYSNTHFDCLNFEYRISSISRRPQIDAALK